MREAVKSTVRYDESENIYEKAKSLIQQGRFIEMTLLEKSDAAWKSLTKGEKAATNRAKAAGNRKGKQFVKQPKKIAKKTARHRK